MSPTLGRSAVLGVLVLLLLGCGGGDRDELVVSAATSLKRPLTEYGRAFEGAAVRLSFAGSDELAAQIRRGVRPDVYAAADTKLPDQLAEEGLVETPVTFATNRLVIAVPRDSTVMQLEDLAEPGVKLAIGSESVPVGAYTREVLGRAPDEVAAMIETNVRSEEPDVKGIVGKLTQGAVDAGFVYRTDVGAAAGDLRAISLPAGLDPAVAYAAGVVEGPGEGEAARAFVEGLRSGACSRALARAGFGPAP